MTMPRYAWPKPVPELSPGFQAIADDFVQHWLTVLPQRYGAVERFNHRYPARCWLAKPHYRTIEIGAGRGAQIAFEDMSRQDYHCVELRENIAADLKRRYPHVAVTIADCQQRLPFPDGQFDRALAIHVLEHLPALPNAVAELKRLLAPQGLLSIVIPCDPGALYSLARKLSAERLFKARYKMPYDWFVAREHINSPAEIFHVLRHELSDNFTEIDRTYFPLRIWSVHCNLCIGTTWRRD